MRGNHEIVDRACAELERGATVEAVLARYPQQAEQLLPLLEGRLALRSLEAVPLPPTAERVAARRHFLSQATQLRKEAVSPGLLARLKGWISQTVMWPAWTWPMASKERKVMYALVAKIIVVVTLGLGSVGGTVALAAESLPGSVLYPVKLQLEEARLALARTPADEAALHFTYAQERVEELEQQALNGDVANEEAIELLAEALQSGLLASAQIPDAGAMRGDLDRDRLQCQSMLNSMRQTQKMVQKQTMNQYRYQSGLEPVEELLAWAIAELEAGIAEPEAFRYRYMYGVTDSVPEPQETGPGQHQQQGPPEGDAPHGNQNAGDVPADPPGPVADPVREQGQQGPGENQPEDSPEPVRNEEESGPPADRPAGNGEPAQDANGAPPEETPGPANESHGTPPEETPEPAQDPHGTPPEDTPEPAQDANGTPGGADPDPTHTESGPQSTVATPTPEREQSGPGPTAEPPGSNHP